MTEAADDRGATLGERLPLEEVVVGDRFHVDQREHVPGGRQPAAVDQVLGGLEEAVHVVALTREGNRKLVHRSRPFVNSGNSMLLAAPPSATGTR